MHWTCYTASILCSKGQEKFAIYKNDLSNLTSNVVRIQKEKQIIQKEICFFHLLLIQVLSVVHHEKTLKPLNQHHQTVPLSEKNVVIDDVVLKL